MRESLSGWSMQCAIGGHICGDASSWSGQIILVSNTSLINDF
uniref:Uncharacterized protein n=1 Tax=Arundo donax TaxID=35708 RepID=A0A0A9AGB4_ARUDO